MARLCIIGASVRAAAASALRAGLDPWCADLFADADLQAIVPDSVRCPFDDYPEGFVNLLKDAPPGPWMYTGGLENYAELIGAITTTRRLWGNGPEALSASRCPFAVQRILRDAGLPSPELFCGQRDSTIRWLRKPFRGSSGQGIAFAEPTIPTRTYFAQQFIDGTPMSAVYMRAGGQAELLGVTEQLIGIDWLNAPPFRYAGSIGSIELAAELRRDLVRVGEALGAGCGLQGLFGVDFVLHDGRPWVVEVNPRYTSSIEVLERASGLCALAQHRTAFELDADSVQLASHCGLVGKAILYASRRLVMPANDWVANDQGSYADIPKAGEIIEQGWPILTCLVEAATRHECLSELRKMAKHLLAVFSE